MGWHGGQEHGLPGEGPARTFERGKKSARGDGIDLATARNVKWAARIGDFCCGTPAVAGGKVFIGGMIEEQGVLHCFDEATGKLLWQWTKPCRTDLQADAMNFRHFPKLLGVCSTPAVDGDRLYFVDQNCVVQCLDVHGQAPAAGAEAGAAKVLWTFDMFADQAVACRPSDACNGSPLVDGDLLYVTTSNGVDRIITLADRGRCRAPLFRAARAHADRARQADGAFPGQGHCPHRGEHAARAVVVALPGDRARTQADLPRRRRRHLLRLRGARRSAAGTGDPEDRLVGRLHPGGISLVRRDGHDRPLHARR